MELLKIAIARGIRETELVPAFEAVLKGGFDRLEITMNTPGSLELISLAARAFGGRALIGAGTVTDMGLMKKALKAGARFIVSPNTDIAMVRYCARNGVPVYPGALTPTEIHAAWKAGATMVKVFPVRSMGGPDYVRDIKGPFDGVKILASGGVTPANLADYARAGVDGIAIGTQIFRKEWLESGSFEKITGAALAFRS